MIMRILRKNGLEVVNLNRRKAIREKCLNCAGWQSREVRECGFSDCALHPFRSGQGGQNPKARAGAIRKFCLGCMNGQRSEVPKCVCPDCPLFPYRKHKVDRSFKIKSYA